MRASPYRKTATLLLLTALLPAQHAVGQVAYQEEYAKLIEAAQTMSPLKSDLFGDKVSLYSGSTEFIQTDISLPGNNALPVAFGRRFPVENRGGSGLTANRYALGDWDMEVPYLSGVYAEGQGWTVRVGNSLARCSGPANADQAQPPDAPTSSDPVLASQFWQAPSLYVPGVGKQSLLFLANQNIPKPTDGATYRWVTKDNWFLSCSNSVTNGTGEGFIARSPSGVTYRFDHMVKLSYPPVKRDRKDANGVDRSTTVNREEVRLYATLVQDRFDNEAGPTLKFPNNYVKYTWSGNQLQSIASNDGRTLTIGYTGDRITSVYDGTRTWTYNYANPTYRALTSVTLPDATSWIFDLGDLNDGRTRYPPSGLVNFVGPHCNKQRELPPPGDLNKHVGTITHPSGAVGTFEFEILRHGRYNVDLICDEGQSGQSIQPIYHAGMYPVQFETNSLVRKTITGAGLPVGGYLWRYDYGVLPGANRCDLGGNCNIGPQSKTVTLYEPDNARTENSYGVRFGENEGQLLGSKTYSSSNEPLREQSFAYVTNAEAPAYPFPQLMGEILNTRGDSMSAAQLRPQKLRSTVQDGATFTWQALGFDNYARYTDTSKSSTLVGAPLTERTSYHDNTAHWVISQVAKVEHLSAGTPIATISENVYDVSKAQLLSESSWGKVRKSFSYYTNGMLASVSDGAGKMTTLANYFRGVPRYVGYPDTTSESATVSNIGNILTVTDEVNYTTTFTYHPTTGRLTGIVPPADAANTWLATSVLFEKTSAAEHGLNMPHWRQVISSGNFSKTTYFDALLRPVLTHDRDVARPGQDRVTVKRFDERGREVFAAYPLAAVPANFADISLKGTRTVYDAIDRTTKVFQHSDGGELETKTEYLTGLKRKVTDPKLNATTTSYWGLEEPGYDKPIEVQAPEGVSVTIQRDLFGMSKRVRRTATINGSTVSVNRQYVYDAHKRLCKLWENETYANYFGYDNADNVAWTVKGFPASLVSSQCDYQEFGSTPKTEYVYDQRNRLKDTLYPAGTTSTFQTYYNDGALKTVSAGNTTWTYEYNSRRLLEKETLQYDGRTFVFDWAYDGLGSVRSLTYPDATIVDYAPDAFGRPTQVGSFATGVSYYPNNAPSVFTYGNGATHSLTQNQRQLPLRSRDLVGSSAVLDFQYGYDGNANVETVTDHAQGGLESKTLGYDALNRLTSATSPLWGGSATMTYDALDNLRSMQVGSRSYAYTLDTARNRISQVVSNVGPTLNLSYNNQGNLTAKGSQAFVFDLANRMTAATTPAGSGGESYVYDGHGRRVSVQKNGETAKRYAVYTLDGKLRHELSTTGAPTHYFYLGDSLVSRLETQSTTPPSVPVLSVNPPTKTDGDFTVSWTNVLANGNYTLTVKRETDAAQNQTLPFSTLSRVFSAPNGGTYAISLRACNSAGACSEAVPLSYGVTPKKVAVVTVPSSTQTGAFNVGWSASVGASYRVDRNFQGGSFTTIAANTSSTTLPQSGLATGTYRYRVTAFNSWGDRGYVESADVVVGSVDPCQGITTLAKPVMAPIALDGTGNGYTVDWDEPSCATAYTLEEKIGNGSWGPAPGYTAPINQSYATFSNRANGTYHYRVRASRPGTTPVPFSPDSDAQSVTVSVSTAPDTPANVMLAVIGSPPSATLMLTGNQNVVQVQWSAVTNVLVEKYIVDRRTDHVTCSASNGEQTVTGSPLPTVLGNQSVPFRCDGTSANPTRYEFKVKACAANDNCSGWSAIAWVEVRPSGGSNPEAIEALQPIYYHTDALGSPAAETDATGSIVRRSRYEPYGGPLDGVYSDKPGYTGHVADATTQLNYMQQRYYDPMLGRFLSVDPMPVDRETGGSFNRYTYANGNPFLYKDPDGRETRIVVNNNSSFFAPTTWAGTHVGMYMDNTDMKGEPIIYDPNGSYRSDIRGSGGFIAGPDVDFSDYVKFQLQDGPDVQIYTFDTTFAEESQIAERITRDGEGRFFSCASNVSAAIKGIGPFKDIDQRSTPSGLGNEIKNAPGAKEVDVSGFKGVFQVQGRLDSKKLDQ